MGLDYKSSGVDIEAGDELVQWLQDSDQTNLPFKSNLISGIGGFASVFKLGGLGYKNPCLVTCTDGVGTKVKLASHFEDYSTVGQDLVAMCVNDLVCTGGRPFLFLDYYATGKLDLRQAQGFLQSVKKACADSMCLLAGGETAEMPGVYHGKDFDCAGFAIGLVEEDKQLGPHLVKDGDVVLAIESSGFHSNGFSLIRKVFEKDLDKWKTELLKPTHLYVKSGLELIEKCEIHALANVTGGGVLNVPRVLPENLEAYLNVIQLPDMFKEVEARTKMPKRELLQTLNCGVGMYVVLPENQVAKAQDILKSHQLRSWVAGKIRPRVNKDGLTLEDV